MICAERLPDGSVAVVRHVARGARFEHWVPFEKGYALDVELKLEVDRRHQRFHFLPAFVPTVPRPWIVALDAVSRRTLQGRR